MGKYFRVQRVDNKTGRRDTVTANGDNAKEVRDFYEGANYTVKGVTQQSKTR